MNWIDVNKELPPNDTNCIVWLSMDIFVDVVFNSKYFGVLDNRFVIYENGGEYEIDLTGKVTHWMIPNKPNS